MISSEAYKPSVVLNLVYTFTPLPRHVTMRWRLIVQ